MDDFKVNPDPDAVAVIVAHVPLAYHVPALMMHPLAAPPVMALRYPVPENDPPVGVDPEPVVVGVPDPAPLGRYLIPVDGQDPV